MTVVISLIKESFKIRKICYVKQLVVFISVRELKDKRINSLYHQLGFFWESSRHTIFIIPLFPFCLNLQIGNIYFWLRIVSSCIRFLSNLLYKKSFKERASPYSLSVITNNHKENDKVNHNDWKHEIGKDLIDRNDG